MIELFAEFFRLNKYEHYPNMKNKDVLFLGNDSYEDCKIIFDQMKLLQYPDSFEVDMDFSFYVKSNEEKEKIMDMLIRFDLSPNKGYFFVKEAIITKRVNMYNGYYFIECKAVIEKNDVDLILSDTALHKIGGNDND